MTDANAPLTPAGRLRLVRRCQDRPIAHVAAEAGIARQTLTKWVRRYDELGESALVNPVQRPALEPDPDPCRTWWTGSRTCAGPTSGPPARFISS